MEVQLNYLIKVGQKEHIESLLKTGQIYANTVEFFRGLEAKDEQRRDNSEGAISSFEPKDFSMSLEDGTTLPLKYENLRMRFYAPEFEKTHLFCMYHVTPEFAGKGPIIDPRNIEFGDTALVITDVEEFINRMQSAGEEYGLNIGPVRYYSLNDDQFNLSVFDKPDFFKHQSEFRFHFSDTSPGPLEFSIGSLEDIAIVIDSEKLRWTKFEYAD